jgi:GntR family transcriptional regulator
MSDMLVRDSAAPLYQQLEEIFHSKIANGEWEPNQRIPSENELNRIYGLSRMTVRSVLTKLVNDGLLLRVPGKGTFVASSKINAVSPAYRGIREQLETLGYATTTQLISLNLVLPTAGVRERLALSADKKVFEITRLRSVNAAPISFHRSYIPSQFAPDMNAHDVVNEQLCVILEERYGLVMHTVRENLEAVAVNNAEAKHLGMRRGEPALLLKDVIFDWTGRPFEYSTIVFRGDRFRLQFDYKL